MSVINGLDALDDDRSTKLRNVRAPRPVPVPKHVREAEATPEEAVVDVRKAPVTAETFDEASHPGPPVKARSPREARAKASTPEVHEEDRRLRQAQLYLDATTDDHLRRIKAAGLVRNVDATYSAVVRHAVAEFVETYGYDEIAELLSGDPVTKRGRGRPRR